MVYISENYKIKQDTLGEASRVVHYKINKTNGT